MSFDKNSNCIFRVLKPVSANFSVFVHDEVRIVSVFWYRIIELQFYTPGKSYFLSVNKTENNGCTYNQNVKHYIVFCPIYLIYCLRFKQVIIRLMLLQRAVQFQHYEFFSLPYSFFYRLFVVFYRHNVATIDIPFVCAFTSFK